MGTRKRDMVVIGASAGGVAALRTLIGALPADLPAVVLVVQHRLADMPGLLAELLNRAGPLPVRDAADGEAALPGHVYLAPPDHHLTLHDGRLRLSRGPKENYSRPAIDPLFRAAAREAGARVVGVVLSGTLFDGAGGLSAIKRAGGMTIVQDPSDAAYPEMPESAIAAAPIDCVLPLEEIAPALVRLAFGEETGSESETETMPSEFDRLPQVVSENREAQIQGERHGKLTVFTCPDCGGSLWQANDGSHVEFRCHVGHAYSSGSLAVQQHEALERALWFAARTLVDRSVLLRQLSENARQNGSLLSARHFSDEARAAEQHAETLRRMIETPDPSTF